MPRPRPVPSAPGMKYCTGCKSDLPTKMFSKNRRQWDGFSNWCKGCMKQDSERRKAADPTYFLAVAARKRWKLKVATLVRYSQDPPSCACCGESEIKFLSIDHIDGGGNAHRKEIGRAFNCIMYWLKRNNYPDGFQVLCFNCNMAKGFYGECPHARVAKSSISA